MRAHGSLPWIVAGALLAAGIASAQPRAEPVEERPLRPGAPREAGAATGEPAHERGARPVKPRTRPDRRLETSPLAPGEKASDRPAAWLPFIEGLDFAPGPLGHVGGEVLAPGGTVTVYGRGFGAKRGRLALKLDARLHDLAVQRWEDHVVSGRITESIREPIARAQAWIVLEREDQYQAPPHPVEFQVPVEVRPLLESDHSLQLLECSDQSNADTCDPNRVKARHENHVVPTPIQIPDVDAGLDRWRIRLFEGWVFHDHALDVKEGNVQGPTPAPEVGAQAWTGQLEWAAGYGEAVEYELDVRVKRARNWSP
jgi:hypothetical protein